jgi:Raf kinase inhibitor-like YbhB/YbcL family protein
MRLEFRSDAWGASDVIPEKYSCDGENISPPLSWGEPPVGTQSFVLIMEDPDAKAVAGQVWDHWLLYNIPAEVRSLPEAIPAENELADGSRHGKTSWGTLKYGGPCPPQGRSHRYVFSFYALDILLDLEPGATKGEIRAAIQGHVLGKAEKTWKYPGE